MFFYFWVVQQAQCISVMRAERLKLSIFATKKVCGERTMNRPEIPHYGKRQTVDRSWLSSPGANDQRPPGSTSRHRSWPPQVTASRVQTRCLAQF